MYRYLFCCLLLAADIGNASGTYQYCPNGCVCSREKHSANCTHVSLKNFPRLPTFVNKVTITHSRFGNLTVNNLKNLTMKGMKITNLRLHRNNISYIEEGALGTLTYLDQLTISESRMDPFMLSKALYSLNATKITFIRLESFENWSNLSTSIFDGLINTNITTISINFMNLSTINGSIFSSLKKLRKLDVSQNHHLNSIDFAGLSRLTILDISHNYLRPLIDFCSHNLSNLNELRYKKNILTALKPLRCLPKLRFLDMSNNPFYDIQDNVIAELPMLETLILKQVGAALMHVRKNAFNSTSLRKLTFEGSKQIFRVTQKSFPSSIFQLCKQLKTLSIAQVNFEEESSQYIRKLLTPLRNIEKLYFESNSLNMLPKNMLLMFPHLTHLSLYGNNEAAWKESDIFHKVKSLKFLNLSHNYISEINETTFPQKMLDSLTQFDLSDNPFACTCDLIWFSELLKADSHKFIGYHQKGNYSCHSPDKLKGDDLFNFKLTEKDCKSMSTLILFTIIISPIALVFLVIFGVAYRYRWYLEYWIYFLKGKNKMSSAPNEDFLYDAFTDYGFTTRCFLN